MPRRLALLAALGLALGLALVAGAGCRTRRPFDVRTAPRPVPLEGQVVEVPVSFAEGIALVPTLVDGKGPFWFALDSGSTTNVLSRRVAEDADVRTEIRRGSIVTEAGRTTGDLEQATLRELRIGRASFRFPLALVTDLDALSRGVGRTVDGILGVPLMRPFVWTLDPADATLTIREGEIAADAEDVIPLTWDDDLPAIAIEVAGRPIKAIVDTGQRLELSLGPDDARGFGTDLPVVGESVGHVLDGAVRRPVARLRGQVQIGAGIVLADPPVLLGRATRVGMRAFEGRALAFDLRNGRMQALRRPGAPAATTPPTPTPAAPGEETRPDDVRVPIPPPPPK